MSAPATTPTGVGGRIVDFVQPLLGFPDDREFELAQVDDQGMILTLRSIHNRELRFVVVPPGRFFPEYEPHIEAADVADLGVDDDGEIQVLTIISIDRTLADATANLMAPIVLSLETGHAKQIVLSDHDLPMRAPLMAGAH